MSQNIIEFAKSINYNLYPVQAFVLKVAYGIPLDPNQTIIVRDAFGKMDWHMREPEYLRFLYLAGRSNVHEVVPGHEFKEIGLIAGRQCGKTHLGKLMMWWEGCRLATDPKYVESFDIPPGSKMNVTFFALNKMMVDHVGQTLKGVVEGKVRLRVTTPTMSHVQGHYMPFSVLDEAAFFTHEAWSPEAWAALWSATQPYGKTATLTTSNKNAPGFRYWWKNPKEDALRLRIPTWEMSPTRTPEDFQKWLERSGREQFDLEWGAEV